MVINRSQIKDILRESGLGVNNIAGDYFEKLEEKVKVMVVESAHRAKENNRRTVMGRDV